MSSFLRISKLKYSKVGNYGGRLGDIDTAYRVIADHLRAACIMISDGVEPGPRNRGLASI